MGAVLASAQGFCIIIGRMVEMVMFFMVVYGSYFWQGMF